MFRILRFVLITFWNVLVAIFSTGLLIIMSPFLAIIMIPIFIIGTLAALFALVIGIGVALAIAKTIISLAIPAVVLYIVLKLLKIF